MRGFILVTSVTLLLSTNACIDMFTGITLNEDGSAWVHLQFQAGEEMVSLLEEVAGIQQAVAKPVFMMNEAELRQWLEADGGRLTSFERTKSNAVVTTVVEAWFPNYQALGKNQGILIEENLGTYKLGFQMPRNEFGAALSQMEQQLRHMDGDADQVLAEQMAMLTPFLEGMHLEMRIEAPFPITGTNLSKESETAGRWVFDFDRDLAGKPPEEMMAAMLQWSQTEPYLTFAE